VQACVAALRPHIYRYSVSCLASQRLALNVTPIVVVKGLAVSLTNLLRAFRASSSARMNGHARTYAQLMRVTGQMGWQTGQKKSPLISADCISLSDMNFQSWPATADIV